MIIVTSSLLKRSIIKMFSFQTKSPAAFSIFCSGLRSVFEKLRFRDGLVRTGQV